MPERADCEITEAYLEKIRKRLHCVASKCEFQDAVFLRYVAVDLLRYIPVKKPAGDADA